MPWHTISYAVAYNIRQIYVFFECPDMPRHPTLVSPYAATFNHGCCSIHLSKILPHFFLLPQAATFTIACCNMLFSYLFQCLGILSRMLLHLPRVFSLCCSIELHMPWNSLPLQFLAQFWFDFAFFDPNTLFITYNTK